MKEWEVALLTAGLSLVVAVISTFITTKLAYRNEKRRLVHEKRSELYFDFYEHIERILSDREVAFSQEYLDKLVEYKARIKLLSSSNTFEAFKNYYGFIKQKRKAYEKYCRQNDPENNPDNLEIDVDENGEEQEIWHISLEELNHFGTLCKTYESEHRPSADEVNQYLVPLYEAMRKDLGSDL